MKPISKEAIQIKIVNKPELKSYSIEGDQGVDEFEDRCRRHGDN